MALTPWQQAKLLFSLLANKLSLKPLFINSRILEIYFSFLMLFPDTMWDGKQSMVKCKKIDIYYNRGVSRFNISRDFRPPSSNLI